MVLPLDALGSYIQGAPQMASEGGSPAILRCTGRVPSRCSCVDHNGSAAEGSTMTPQVTTAGSSCTSCTRRVHRKRSDLIPVGAGRDTACDRYIDKISTK